MKQLLWVLLFAASSASASEHVIPRAVKNALAWEKRWYGSHFGEQCLTRMGGKDLTLRFALEKQQRTIGTNCNTGAPVMVPAIMFSALVDGAGILVTGQVSPYPHAVISDGEARSDCQITEDDLRRVTAHLKSSLRMTSSNMDTSDRRMVSDALDSFIARTIRAYTKHQESPPTSVLVGKIYESDPFAVAMLGDGKYVLVEIPDAREVEDPAFCGMVFNGGRFVGRSPVERPLPDDQSRIRDTLERDGRRIRLTP